MSRRPTTLTSAEVEELIEAVTLRLDHVRHRSDKALTVERVLDKLLGLRREGPGRVWIISD